MRVYRKEEHEWTTNEYGVSIFTVPGRAMGEGSAEELPPYIPQVLVRSRTRDKVVAYLTAHREASIGQIRISLGLTIHAAKGTLTGNPRVFKVARVVPGTRPTRMWGLA